MPRRFSSPTLAVLLAAGCTNNGSTSASGTATSTASTDAASTGAATDTDTADPTGGQTEPAYCRTLDPAWADNYQSPLDQQLRAIIEKEGLLGDPALYVDEQGQCARRPLPAIDQPLAQLGRDLFFSKDLSGDRDVACASCHHPYLAGGDAIALPIGPTPNHDAMGADRVTGLTDITKIHVPRNANTTFNIAFWDDGLFWDSRVQSLAPDAGFNGAGGPMTTPDAPSISEPAPDPGATLPEAQSRFPVTEAHEMAGSWAALYPSRTAIRDALAARMADDPAWVDRFRAVCDQPGLPDTWSAACAADQPDQLVAFNHISYAIGEYERSQVFTDSPWRAYVQGDVAAIPDAAKQGALQFFREVKDGGQNCAACHTGDFFTDEEFHRVASPQIGPGKADGLDRGRGLLTAVVDDDYRFRTATLLNIELTAPYFHAGAHATLNQAIRHYHNPNGRLFEYFGTGNKSELNLRPWCRMTEFKDIPGCADLYTIEGTQGGQITPLLDPELEGITTEEGFNAALIEAFLRTLTDPRARNRAALSPWVDPTSTLVVSDTSSEWPRYCEVEIERAADILLHIQGFRWALTGEIVDGGDVNADELLYDTFGVAYWQYFDLEFTAASGVSQTANQLAVATLELLTPTQRQALYGAYAAIVAGGDHAEIRARRLEVFDRMNQRRAGTPVADAEFTARIAEAAAREGKVLHAMAKAYRDATLALDEPARTAQRAAFEAVRRGDLSVLPPGVYTPGNKALTQSDAIKKEVNAIDDGPDGVGWDGFAAGYLTWTLGWDCRNAFMSRSDEDSRVTNYFGFSRWANSYLFDLQTGAVGSGGFQEEMSLVIGAQEQSLGVADLFAATLPATIDLQRQYQDRRRVLVTTLMKLQDLALDPATVAALADDVIAANSEVAQSDAALLLKQLDYYVGLWQAIEQSGAQALPKFLACIEDPATQALKGNGGFEGNGGGSCNP